MASELIMASVYMEASAWMPSNRKTDCAVWMADKERLTELLKDIQRKIQNSKGLRIYESNL